MHFVREIRLRRVKCLRQLYALRAGMRNISHHFATEEQNTTMAKP